MRVREGKLREICWGIENLDYKLRRKQVRKEGEKDDSKGFEGNGEVNKTRRRKSKDKE